jgi:uncharacterized protein (DUF2252 family)
VLATARNFKMARSAHAYVRGNTLQFYEWLDSLAPSTLPEGPAVWICGDCHLGNLGPVANAKGIVEIQVRDFDQTVIGNPAHDLIRLGLSLCMAARGSDLPGVTSARMIERMVEGYAEEFEPGRRKTIAERPQSVYRALREAERRSWRHLARERVAGTTVALPLGRRFWNISEEERRALAALLNSEEVRALATSLSHRSDGAEVELLDAAYWVKGCSSLGLLRYAALLDVEGRATRGRDMCLIDIKEATTAIAPRAAGGGMPRENAQRVVEGARHMSPHLGERMVASRLLDKSVFLRELLPEDLKLELEQVGVEEAVRSAHYLARVVGKAHARQMDREQRRAWRAELARNRSRTLDAPTWLWASVVKLVASHEEGYLEHCRRYALGSFEDTEKRAA